ncbi:hypothetical protein HT031_004705 [Scenedesmus sp. PABB004]|nr:hypothetical protein HT031_004705 [Scenedesmus sp. PABB004]
MMASAPGGDLCGKPGSRRGRPGAAAALARAVATLAAVEPSPGEPQQVALLVSGTLLACSWRFMSARLAGFEARGAASLAEVWLVVAASVGLGQVARVVARQTPVGAYISECQSAAVAQQAAAVRAALAPPPAPKEGRELGHPAALEGDDPDADDVGVQKRAAQAEAAARLAECQAGVRALLGRVGAGGAGAADEAAALHRLAEQLFGSPVSVCELVAQGGVPAVAGAAERSAHALPGAAPALLQASWVLLQVAHGPPACCAALMDARLVRALAGAARRVLDAPAVPAEAKSAVLRNLAWTLLVLCDGHSSASKSAAPAPSSAAACAAALADAGGVELLAGLAGLQCGAEAGWVAIACLGLFMQRGQEAAAAAQQQQQQQQQAAAEQLAAAAAADAMLQPESLHGLAHLLARPPQLGARAAGLVSGQLHYLLAARAPELLRGLIEERLVGAVARAAAPRLGRLLVCQLLSSRGQEIMAEVEAAYELDVPLALAQAIPAPVHLKLPPAPAAAAQQQQQQPQPGGGADAGGEIQPEPEPEAQPRAGGTAAAQRAKAPAAPAGAGGDDVYTDVLACRLLLQHSRLDELLSAFADELLLADAPGDAPPPPVCAAVLELVGHLMSRDLQLAAVALERGDSVDGASASGSASSSASSSAGSALDAALAAPDASGVYSSVLAGLVPDVALPAPRRGGEAGPAQLTLPPLPAGAAPPAAGRARVVFDFGGGLRQAVDRDTFKRLRGASSLLGSMLRADAGRGGAPVTVLSTPHFTGEANAWVLACLVRWLHTGGLAGFAPAQAAKLWVAADFLQVDGLQVACEDVLIAAAAADDAQLDVALELASRHRASAARLARLAAQAALRRLSDAGAPGLGRLRALLAAHRPVLLAGVFGELRDRLVTLCMLNAGLDDDTPGDLVG